MDKEKTGWEQLFERNPSFKSYTGRVYMDLKDVYLTAYRQGYKDALDTVLELAKKGEKK